MLHEINVPSPFAQTSLALLGFVSRALAHAQLVLLSEMQQENSTDGRSNLSFDGSKLTIDDTVSTEFTIINDEDIPGEKFKTQETNLLGRKHLVDMITSIPSSIPSGATELPGLHGRTPLIWKWDESVTQVTRSNPKNRRGERKSNDFPSHDCNSSPKTLAERSSKTGKTHYFKCPLFMLKLCEFVIKKNCHTICRSKGFVMILIILMNGLLQVKRLHLEGFVDLRFNFQTFSSSI